MFLDDEDIDAVTKPEVLREIARSLDPLAFDNDSEHDRDLRRFIVYSRMKIAYSQFGRSLIGFDGALEESLGLDSE